MRAIVGVTLLLALASPVLSSEKPKGKDAAAVDERYTPAGLRQTFAAVCKKLGYRARVVEVINPSFPIFSTEYLKDVAIIARSAMRFHQYPASLIKAA